MSSNNTPKIKCVDTTSNAIINTNENEEFAVLKGEKAENSDVKTTMPAIRRSTRSTRYQTSGNESFDRKKKREKKVLTNDRNRRDLIFKKTVSYKAPDSLPSIVTRGYVFHKNSYIQIGDIVSMTDKYGDIYYAQIRGLISDQYCEKSAVVTWLLPTNQSPDPNKKFDPATFVIGPEEETARPLDTMDFVMHAPSDYYKASSPYPEIQPLPVGNFLWAQLKAVKLLQK